MTQLSSSLLPTDDTGDLTSGTALSRAFFTDWRDGINTLIHSATNPTVTPVNIIDEVVAARGGEASLDAYLDTLVALIGAAGDAVDVPADFGENVSAGDAIYLSSGSGGKTAGKWYKTDSANTYSSSIAKSVGFAPSAVLSGASDFSRLSGRITGLAGLTAGTVYYASSTPGGLTSTPPANALIMGVALSTTVLLITSATRIQALQAILDAAKGSATDLDTRLDATLAADGYILDPYTKQIKHTAGTAGNTGPAPVRVNASTATANNGTTVETDLHSFTFEGGSLDEDGDELIYRATGSCANTASTKTLKFKFGAAVVSVLSGAFSSPGAVVYWDFEVRVVRLTSTTQRLIPRFSYQSTGNEVGQFVAEVSGTETLANDITVKMTGQSSASSNDVTQTYSRAIVQ